MAILSNDSEFTDGGKIASEKMVKSITDIHKLKINTLVEDSHRNMDYLVDIDFRLSLSELEV